eukprot:6205560-Pleurochrysis_carterae.AAC.4
MEVLKFEENAGSNVTSTDIWRNQPQPRQHSDRRSPLSQIQAYEVRPEQLQKECTEGRQTDKEFSPEYTREYATDRRCQEEEEKSTSENKRVKEEQCKEGWCRESLSGGRMGGRRERKAGRDGGRGSLSKREQGSLRGKMISGVGETVGMRTEVGRGRGSGRGRGRGEERGKRERGTRSVRARQKARPHEGARDATG